MIGNKQKKGHLVRFNIIALEERVVLDASFVSELVALDSYSYEEEMQVEGKALDAIDSGLVDFIGIGSSGAEVEKNRHVLVIASNLSDTTLLLEAAREDVLVIYYDSETTSFEQLPDFISQKLGNEEAASIGFVNHGSAGNFLLSNDLKISKDSLTQSNEQRQFWSDIGDLLQDDGRIDLLSCNLSETQDGLDLITEIESLSGAQVAASTDHTGRAALGGDWFLETGGINADAIYFSHSELLEWNHVLSNSAPVLEGVNQETPGAESLYAQFSGNSNGKNGIFVEELDP